MKNIEPFDLYRYNLQEIKTTLTALLYIFRLGIFIVMTQSLFIYWYIVPYFMCRFCHSYFLRPWQLQFNCSAFGSGTFTTCFNYFGRLQPGFKPRSHALRQIFFQYDNFCDGTCKRNFFFKMSIYIRYCRSFEDGSWCTINIIV